MPPTVLIADDERAVRRSVRSALENAGFAVCAEVVDGYEAIDRATALSPDVIVLDLRMPMLNGVEVAFLLRHKVPGSKIVLFSMYEVGQAVAGLSGVSAVVCKTDGLPELVDCVRRLAGNRSE